VVSRVLRDGAYSHIALDAALAGAQISAQDRGLATRIVYGTLTWLRPIDAILAPHVRSGLDRVNPIVLDILRVATFQLGWLDRVPDHAVVNEAVSHTRKVRSRASGFVNGVLRNALRARETWPATGASAPTPGTPEDLGLVWSLPDWLARRWSRDLGLGDACQAAAVMADTPPLSLRARTPNGLALGTPAAAPMAIRAEGWSAEITAAIKAGDAAVQDVAAQLVSLLANPAASATILDACAGQGGKALHLADLTGPAATIVAVDNHTRRLHRIPSHPAIRLAPGDLREHSLKSLGVPEPGFDLVVVDAPCSGLGVLRRHPEIRWTRGEEEIASLASLQTELLDHAVKLVRPGGHLVYAVCTFTPEEGNDQIARLLAANPTLSLNLDGGREGVDWGQLRRASHGYLVLPQDQDCDGFFLSRLAVHP
jgi:16S rRNA (cytosine967-C5)-methyltransferase